MEFKSAGLSVYTITMNIGIFETEHFEGAYPVIKLFDTHENKLILFTDVKTHKRFCDLFKSQADKYQWVIEDLENNRFTFFLKMFSAAKKHKLDILYLNTISSNHLLYGFLVKLLPATRIIITIHDINCFFESRLTTGIRESVQHIGKRVLLNHVKEFNVVSDTMIPYLKKKNERIKIHNIPGAVFEHRIKTNTINKSIHLVVPGSIDGKRRDYDKVFDVLSKAEAIELPLHITLLGGPHKEYGATIISRAAEFKGKNTRLFYYTKKVVDQDEFDEKLDSAHFIFIPSVVQTTICNNIPEVYGITKSSGNIFDVIKHAKPFIVPTELVIPPDLSDSCFTYESIHKLVIFLKTLFESQEQYSIWHQNAIKNSEKYTIEKIRSKNPSLFGNLAGN
jgi:hypothetical protein